MTDKPSEETIDNVNVIKSHYKFPEFHEVKGRKSIIHLFNSTMRCGIYILKFSNNEYYVGQSIDIAKRFIQHSKIHQDIEAISFIFVPKDELNLKEQKIIADFDTKKIYIRNIALASIPKGVSDLDMLWNIENQDKWLENFNQLPSIKDRIIDENQRRKYSLKFLLLKKESNYVELKRCLNSYFKFCIPETFLTEFKESKVFCRINMFLQEVLTIGFDKINNTMFYSFHVSKSVLERNNFLEGYEDGIYEFTFEKEKPVSLYLTNHYYKTGGADQICIDVYTQEEAVRLICDPYFQSAIKDFNLRLMKKGIGFNKSSHCFDLVSDIIK